MATELRDCQSNTDNQNCDILYNPAQNLVQHKDTRFRYNEAKIKLLSAIYYLNQKGDIANSARIKILTGMNTDYVNTSIRRMHGQYFKRELDNYTTNGCTIKVKMIDKGIRKLNDMLDRMENNLTLHLSKLPKQKDYSNFILLPGIEEYERLRAEGKI